MKVLHIFCILDSFILIPQREGRIKYILSYLPSSSFPRVTPIIQKSKEIIYLYTRKKHTNFQN